MDKLHVQNISLSFGGIRACIGVDFGIRTGEILAVIGPNGAGKTSLINSINGFYRPQEGRILFEGRDISDLPPATLQTRPNGHLADVSEHRPLHQHDRPR